MTALAALLLFGCGMLACLAWSAGLYASAAVSALAALWLSAGMLWRQSRLSPLGNELPTVPPSVGPDPETARRRLQSMLDQTPAPLLTVASDNIPRAANRAARRLFRTDDRIPLPPPALLAAIERIRPGERAVLKLPGRASGDAERSYALSVANSVGPDGAVRLAVLTDIQAELQAAEAAALRDLLQVLSHEIMNSLTPVTSLAESAHAMLAEGRPEDVPHALDALETILRRAGGLDRFVRGYRLLARLPPPEPQPASVTALLRHVETLFRMTWPDVTLALVPPSPDIVVRLDFDQLVQALLNLLANAAEAARDGKAPPARVWLSGGVHETGIAIRVADSGDGVAAGQEDTIFRPFFTGKPNGTGIGLGLARQIAWSHGGALVLEAPAPDRGAAFLLTL